MIKKIQLTLAIFVAISAIGGFAMMMSDPEGVRTGTRPLMEMMAEAFPFASCLFSSVVPSALALLLVNGISNIISAWLLYTNHRLGQKSTLLCGVLLIIWTSVEIYAWGVNGLSVVYGGVGLAQVLFGACQRQVIM